jgi:hypothetical protein
MRLVVMLPIRRAALRATALSSVALLGLAAAGSAQAAYLVQVSSSSGDGTNAGANCAYNYGSDSCVAGPGASGSTTPSGSGNAVTATATTATSNIASSGFATSDLTTGSLHLAVTSSATSGGAGGSTSETEVANFSDVLHYTVAGASADTVTAITVTVSVDGVMSLSGTNINDNTASGELLGSMTFGSSDARFIFQNNYTTGFATLATLDTYPSAYPGTWTSNADNTQAFYTETYNVVGASGDISLSLDASLQCFNGMNCNYGDTAKIGISGPADFSYTSDSGALLTASAVTGGVPEPATWALMLLGFGGLGATLRRARRPALA